MAMDIHFAAALPRILDKLDGIKKVRNNVLLHAVEEVQCQVLKGIGEVIAACSPCNVEDVCDSDFLQLLLGASHRVSAQEEIIGDFRANFAIPFHFDFLDFITAFPSFHGIFFPLDDVLDERRMW